MRGGIRAATDSPDTWHSEDGHYTYRLVGADLRIGDATGQMVTVRDFQNGALGISLSEAREPGVPVAPANRTDRQHPLLQQSQSAVERLDRALVRAPDQASARMSASLACLALEGGLSRIDHVVLSRSSGNVREWENVFVVQGDLNDPARHVAHMKTAFAVRAPVEESLQRLRELDRVAPPSVQLAQHEQQNPQQERRSLTM